MHLPLMISSFTSSIFTLLLARTLLASPTASPRTSPRLEQGNLATNLTFNPDPFHLHTGNYIITFRLYSEPLTSIRDFQTFLHYTYIALDRQTHGMAPNATIPGGEFRYASATVPLQFKLVPRDVGTGITNTEVKLVLDALQAWALHGGEEWVPETYFKLQHLESLMTEIGWGEMERQSHGAGTANKAGTETGIEEEGSSGKVAPS